MQLRGHLWVVWRGHLGVCLCIRLLAGLRVRSFSLLIDQAFSLSALPLVSIGLGKYSLAGSVWQCLGWWPLTGFAWIPPSLCLICCLAPPTLKAAVSSLSIVVEFNNIDVPPKHSQGVELVAIMNKSSECQVWALEPRTTGLQVQHPNHSATLPVYLLKCWNI